ncbi:MAG: SBBP repeat-containing protein, partial [Candidatus Hodarchaeota archaeon]
NKKYYLTVFILVLYYTIQISSVLSTNNSFGYRWSRTWGGTSTDVGYGVAVDSSDNIYFVGYTESYGPGYVAMLVLKYDDSGTLLWNRTWGGSDYDNCYAVAVDSSDNVYLAGETDSFGAGGYDMILVKFDNSGVQLWNRTWGGSTISKRDDAWGVTVDSLDNVYLVGETNDFGEGEEDMVLVKYDSTGAQLWNRTWGGSLSDSGLEVAVDSSDNVYLAGRSYSFGAGEADMVLVKYDSTGEQLWNRTWGGTLSDEGLGVTIDSSDNIYLTGTTYSFGEGDRDMVLVKYDSTGEQLWNRTYGGNRFDDANDVMIDSFDNVYIVGDTKSIPKIEPDIVMVKYTSSGVQLFNQTWGGDYIELCYGGAIDSADNVYLGGTKDDYASMSNMLLVKFGYREEQGQGKPEISGYSLLIVLSLIGLITVAYSKRKYKK